MYAHLLSFGYDHVIMRVRTMLLRVAGYQVTEIRTWNDILPLVSRNHFDLLLLCHTVPEDQQEALIQCVEEHGGTMPVLCLSSNPDINQSQSCQVVSNTAPELLRQIDEALQESSERWAA